MGRSRNLLEVKGATFLSPPPPPYWLSPPNNVVGSEDSNVKDNVSPSVLLIIIILAIVFFVSGLLHLLVRYLWRPQTRDPDDLDDVTVLQGQLQQLFHLHDSGVDQSFINTLPVFLYKAIIGLKNPFDCAVCLSEFEPDDKLRLLPKCSHAFHMECIDTWLLSHSTCPICRACLLSDFSSSNACSPTVLVLESGSDNNSREIDPETDELEFGSTRFDLNEDSGEVVTVKLGKIRNVDNNNGEGSSRTGDFNDNAEARRCFSMGSFAYVMDESTLLHVPIRAQIKKKHALYLNPGNRLAVSEYDCESRRDFRFSSLEGNRFEEAAKCSSSGVITRKESLSVSKIWLREKKEKRINRLEDSTRRAVSFRLPFQRNDEEDEDGGGGLKERNVKLGSRSTISDMDITNWDENNGGGGSSEYGYDDENQSCYSVDSSQVIRAPSFARRTLLWLTGRQHHQNKVVHSASVSGD
ncbi:hypothetical protein QN277_007181 [Acacia crassicarpa]|uniref:RING-type E3 ubiquitin transferase n=1 Tax=Acacia crassicarpa TaxID=499986 RepID=A0AAE1MCQ4_9FABA|nr:hypothetical protein QN277_007181 [Acacia crassicarpa]